MPRMTDPISAAPLHRPLSLAVYMHDLAGGGVERMRLALIAELRRRGVAVTLLLHRRAGALIDRLPPDLPLVVLGGRRTAADVLPLLRFLRREAPDLLMASLDHNNIVALAAKALARTRTRLVICQHNALSREAAEMGSWKYRAVPTLYRRLQRFADGVVAVSAGVAEDLARTAGLPRDRITVIHNPVIGPDFASRCAEPATHPWLQDRAIPVFASVGRLVPQKDPATLLRGFALRRAAGPARLMFIGDGPMQAELAILAAALGVAEDVCFLGFQPNPLPFIREAAALVLASRYEGLGNVLIEALGCGTPVISTDCPHGPSEILARGSYGALVPVGDPAALARAMAGQPRRRWSAALLRDRAEDFTASWAAERHLDLFARLDAPCP